MNVDRKQLKDNFVHTLDLPQDLFLGLPNISLCGNKEIYISNHHGILSYDVNTACILVKGFQIQITGRELYFSSYTKDDLTVRGYIRSVEFI